MHLSRGLFGPFVGVRITAALAAIVALGLAARDSRAQVEIKANAVEIRLTGRLHAQWRSTSVADDELVNNEFLIRRARATFEIKVNELVRGKIQPDYGQETFTLKDAYIDLLFHDAFQLRMGQFKRPFDFFELESSTRNLLIERAGTIPGADLCAGVGNICSYSRFTEKLGFSDRDIGIRLSGTPGEFAWSLSATNGRGISRFDENDAKSFSGRLEYRPLNDLMIAGNVAAHDFVNDTTSDRNDYAWAYGGDLNWGDYAGGLHVQAAVVGGQNWKNLDGGGEASDFVAVQAVVSYRVPIENSPILTALEPVGRVSWGDPDTDASDDDGVLLTPGLIIYFSGRNKFAVNADIYSPSGGDTEWSGKAQMYLHF